MSQFDTHFTEKAKLQTRIRNLDRAIYEEEQEKASLNARAGTGGDFAGDVKKIDAVEERLRKLRQERRRLDEQLDRLLRDEANLQTNEAVLKKSHYQDIINELRQEKERILEKELPEARKRVLELEDRLDRIDREMREAFDVLSDLEMG